LRALPTTFTQTGSMHVVLIVCAAAVGSDGEGERLDDGAPEWESMEQEQRTVVYCSIQCVPWASGLIVHVAFGAHLTFELVAVPNLSRRAFAFASPRYWQWRARTPQMRAMGWPDCAASVVAILLGVYMLVQGSQRDRRANATASPYAPDQCRALQPAPNFVAARGWLCSRTF